MFVLFFLQCLACVVSCAGWVGSDFAFVLWVGQELRCGRMSLDSILQACVVFMHVGVGFSICVCLVLCCALVVQIVWGTLAQPNDQTQSPTHPVNT